MATELPCFFGKFPVLLFSEFGYKALMSFASSQQSHGEHQIIEKFPANFPVAANYPAETGSILTASATIPAFLDVPV
ncbi:MAG: hypothetical protein AB7O50_08325 [Pseudolabrys sp.]